MLDDLDYPLAIVLVGLARIKRQQEEKDLLDGRVPI